MKNNSSILGINKKRPTGLDIGSYMGCESWSFHQWAWEFLRRNDNFIIECNEVKLGQKSKQAVARKFGLKLFRNFSLNYIHKTVPPPKFIIDSPFLWSDLTLSKRKARKIQLNLRSGQIIIRLDLGAAIEHEGAIEKQINNAMDLIRDYAAQFKSSYPDSSKTHSRKENTFGIYMRLLDLKANKKSNLECGKILLTKKIKDGATNDDLREDIKQRLKQAREISNNDYKYLSVREGGPSAGTVKAFEV